ncbi:MAG: hypothetical protein M2R45_01678 [Verrucomicrobia subdivision 3 bacterium]|nr:hypothetical protein [Limisphaerales bacterium]
MLFLDFPAFSARQTLALFHLLACFQLAAMVGLLRVDDVDFVADVDAVGDGLLMDVLADHILLEEPIGAVVRGGGQADQAGVEILQNLAPEVVDGAVAFVDDDEVEEFGRNLGAVDDGHRFPP